MYVCMYGGLSEDRSTTGPQWFPELQWYVEEETSSRKEQMLPREEETTSMAAKSPQGKNKISSRKDETYSRRPSSVPRFHPYHTIGFSHLLQDLYNRNETYRTQCITFEVFEIIVIIFTK